MLIAAGATRATSLGSAPLIRADRPACNSICLPTSATGLDGSPRAVRDTGDRTIGIAD